MYWEGVAPAIVTEIGQLRLREVACGVWACPLRPVGCHPPVLTGDAPAVRPAPGPGEGAGQVARGTWHVVVVVDPPWW